jgi:hypothetical protein
VEVQEGDEGEPILSSRMVASLCKSGSMRSSLDAGTNREKVRALESQTGSLDKVQNWPLDARHPDPPQLDFPRPP